MKRSWLIIILLLYCFQSLNAQFDSAVVLGTVRDELDQVIPGATVKLENLSTGITFTGSTSSSGDYQFLNVKVGIYAVSAEKEGFSVSRTENFNVTVNARQRVDLTLKVGELTQVIDVVGAAATVESDSSDRGQIINKKQIVELPLNGRAYADLALLTTGVRRSDYAFANPPREGSFNINGQRSIFNNFLLDGIDNNAYGTSNQAIRRRWIVLDNLWKRKAAADARAHRTSTTSRPSAAPRTLIRSSTTRRALSGSCLSAGDAGTSATFPEGPTTCWAVGS